MSTIIRGWSLLELLRYRQRIRAAEVDEPRTFRIERYQRDFAWGPEDEAQDLFLDLAEHFDEASAGTYVLGNMILCPGQDERPVDALGLSTLDDFEVVDGQQRLTSLLLLLAALRAEASHRGWNSLSDEITDAISGVSFVHHESDLTSFLSTLIDDPDGNGWNAAFSNSDIDGPSRSLENCQDVAKHFRDLIVRQAEPDSSRVIRLADRLLKNVIVGATIAADRGTALISFERANARGRDLDATDLLKNFVFMLEERRNSQRENWDSIDAVWKELRSLAEDGSPRIKFADVIRWHHEVQSDKKFTGASLYRNISAEMDSYDAYGTDYVEDLRATTEWICSVHRDSQRITDSGKENVLDGLKGLELIRGRSRMVQHLPLLLGARSWEVGEFRAFARAMESLMLVSMVCQVRGQTLESYFDQLRLEIRSSSADEAARPAITESVQVKAQQLAEEYGFESMLFRLSYERSRDTLLIRYVLSRVDAAVRTRAQLDAWADAEVFVETANRTGRSAQRVRDDLDHVWPQSRQQDWPGDPQLFHTIGNLVLWTKRSNRSVGDAPASEKLSNHYRSNHENQVRYLLASGIDDDSDYLPVRRLGLTSETDWGEEQAKRLRDVYLAVLRQVFEWDPRV